MNLRNASFGSEWVELGHVTVMSRCFWKGVMIAFQPSIPLLSESFARAAAMFLGTQALRGAVSRLALPPSRLETLDARLAARATGTHV